MKNSNIYYINDRLDKRTWTYIFGACCATTVFIPSFHNYRIWSFLGLGMTTYTAWYLTIASFTHGQVKLITTFFVFHLKRVNGVSWFGSILWFQAEGVTHSAPTKLVLYFTGATNILYTFGGHAVTVWVLSFYTAYYPLFFSLVSTRLLCAAFAGHLGVGDPQTISCNLLSFFLFARKQHYPPSLFSRKNACTVKMSFAVCILVFVSFVFNHCEFFTLNS